LLVDIAFLVVNDEIVIHLGESTIPYLVASFLQRDFLPANKASAYLIGYIRHNHLLSRQ
jgi:hypothetical protein